MFLNAFPASAGLRQLKSRALGASAVVQKGLIVSVITVMRTSQTEASEPQLVR